MSYASLLTDTVTIALQTGITTSGDPTYGAKTTIKARVEYGTKLVYGADGSAKECEASLATMTELPMQTRIWLPGDNTGDNNAAKRPILTKRASTPSGSLVVYETYL